MLPTYSRAVKFCAYKCERIKGAGSTMGLVSRLDQQGQWTGKVVKGEKSCFLRAKDCTKKQSVTAESLTTFRNMGNTVHTTEHKHPRAELKSLARYSNEISLWIPNLFNNSYFISTSHKVYLPTVG
jgi:hypothetical protein